MPSLTSPPPNGIIKSNQITKMHQQECQLYIYSYKHTYNYIYTYRNLFGLTVRNCQRALYWFPSMNKLRYVVDVVDFCQWINYRVKVVTTLSQHCSIRSSHLCADQSTGAKEFPLQAVCVCGYVCGHKASLSASHPLPSRSAFYPIDSVSLFGKWMGYCLGLSAFGGTVGMFFGRPVHWLWFTSLPGCRSAEKHVSVVLCLLLLALLPDQSIPCRTSTFFFGNFVWIWLDSGSYQIIHSGERSLFMAAITQKPPEL